MQSGGPSEDAWFSERFQGLATALEVEEVLLEKQTEFQRLLVFRSRCWGRVLVLDGAIQVTQRDEMAYQEMLTHLAMFSHRDPRRVLVVGGGDGGVIREVCKHGGVQAATLCEIDPEVISAARRYFPAMASALDDPRVTVNVGDGVAFLAAAADSSYDIIIIDSSDPVGPGKKLFTPRFYRNVHRVLAPGGIVCSQGESMWVKLDLVRNMIKQHGEPFFSAEYASIQVPTYLGGQIGAFIARKADPAQPQLEASCQKPLRRPWGMDLRYYSAAMHSAAFQLPEFVQKQLYTKRTDRAEGPRDGSPPTCASALRRLVKMLFWCDGQRQKV